MLYMGTGCCLSSLIDWESATRRAARDSDAPSYSGPTHLTSAVPTYITKGFLRVYSPQDLEQSQSTIHPFAAFTCRDFHSSPTLLPASAAMIDHDRRINHGACWCDVIGRGRPMIPLITNLTISEHNDIKQLQPRHLCMCSSEVYRQKRSAPATPIATSRTACPQLEKNCDRRKATRERESRAWGDGLSAGLRSRQRWNYIGSTVRAKRLRTSDSAGLSGSQILPCAEIDSTSPLAAVTLCPPPPTSHDRCRTT